MNAGITIISGLAMIAGSPGMGEIAVLFIIFLLLFGPKKLPSIARSIGKTIEELRKASNDFKEQIMKIDEIASVDIPPEDISVRDSMDYDYSSEQEYNDSSTAADDADYVDSAVYDDVPAEPVEPDADRKSESEPVILDESAGKDEEGQEKDDNVG